MRKVTTMMRTMIIKIMMMTLMKMKNMMVMGSIGKIIKKKMLPTSFLVLDHAYVCYMTSHVKFC
jgi:hypothetical protein